MRLLFDTHAFLWWAEEPAKLSPPVFAACKDRSNQLLLSIASIWEIQLKVQLGKLRLQLPLANLVQDQRERNQIGILPIVLTHVLELDNLPLHHRDPFDRILIAQSRVENITLLSNDAIVTQYPIRVLW